MRVCGAGGGRVSIAGVACYRPGDRPHLFHQLRICRRRKGEPKGFTWADYRDLIISAHPIYQPRWSGSGITSTSTSRRSWRTSPRRTRNGCASTGCRLICAEIEWAEGISSLLKRSMANFAAADQAGLVRIIKRKLKKIQYRPHLINACLGRHRPEDRALVTPCTTSSTWLTPSGSRVPKAAPSTPRSGGRPGPGT